MYRKASRSKHSTGNKGGNLTMLDYARGIPSCAPTAQCRNNDYFTKWRGMAKKGVIVRFIRKAELITYRGQYHQAGYGIAVDPKENIAYGQDSGSALANYYGTMTFIKMMSKLIVATYLDKPVEIKEKLFQPFVEKGR